MKSCVIFKTNKQYKIVTESETDTGLFMSDKPVYILSSDVSNEILQDKIFQSLNNSKTNVEFPDTSEKVKKWEKQQLERIKEKSFDTLYKNSKSCLIRIIEDDLIVYPYFYKSRKMGLIVKEEDVKKFSLSESDKERVVKYVINILGT